MNVLFALLFALTAPWRQQEPQLHPTTSRDSTIRVVQDVGVAVADVRGNLEHFRMLLVTDSLASGAHVQAATALDSACHKLVQVTTQGRRVMCLRCMGAQLQPAFTGYRDYLPSVAAMGRRCVARMDRTRVETARPSAKRQLALDLATIVVTGLRPYERRVNDVLTAMRAPAPGRSAAERRPPAP